MIAKKLRKINNEVGYEVLPGDPIPIFMQNYASGQYVTITISLPGTMDDNFVHTSEFPFDVILKYVSVVGSNDSDATISIGDNIDRVDILLNAPVGDDREVILYDNSDFEIGATGAIPAGHRTDITIDYGGPGGTPVDNLALVAWYEIS